MHRDKSCLLFLSLARTLFAQIPIKNRVFDTQGHSRMFLVGGSTSCTAVAQGQRSPCARRWSDVAQEIPPQVCSGGVLIMCSQAGGSWEDLTDEPSSSFTRRNVMRTRCRSAFGTFQYKWTRGNSMA